MVSVIIAIVVFVIVANVQVWSDNQVYRKRNNDD
jgi:hypothetical protein